MNMWIITKNTSWYSDYFFSAKIKKVKQINALQFSGYLIFGDKSKPPPRANPLKIRCPTSVRFFSWLFLQFWCIHRWNFCLCQGLKISILPICTCSESESFFRLYIGMRELNSCGFQKKNSRNTALKCSSIRQY